MAFSPAPSGWCHNVLSVSAPFTIFPSSTRAASPVRLYFFRMASKEHSFPWCPSSTAGTSNGVGTNPRASASSPAEEFVSDCRFAQKDVSEELALLHHFSTNKNQNGGEICFIITV